MGKRQGRRARSRPHREPRPFIRRTRENDQHTQIMPNAPQGSVETFLQQLRSYISVIKDLAGGVQALKTLYMVTGSACWKLFEIYRWWQQTSEVSAGWLQRSPPTAALAIY